MEAALSDIADRKRELSMEIEEPDNSEREKEIQVTAVPFLSHVICCVVESHCKSHRWNACRCFYGILSFSCTFTNDYVGETTTNPRERCGNRTVVEKERKYQGRDRKANSKHREDLVAN